MEDDPWVFPVYFPRHLLFTKVFCIFFIQLFWSGLRNLFLPTDDSQRWVKVYISRVSAYPRMKVIYPRMKSQCVKGIYIKGFSLPTDESNLPTDEVDPWVKVAAVQILVLLSPICS